MKLPAFIIFLILPVFCLCAENVKLAFLSHNSFNPTENGILVGANDYMQKAKIRFGKDFSAEIFPISNNLPKQLKELKSKGFSGAFVSLGTSDKNTDNLPQIDGFYTAFINAKSTPKNAIFAVSCNAQVKDNILIGFLKKRTNIRNFTLIHLFNANVPIAEQLNKARSIELALPYFSKPQFEKICETSPNSQFFAAKYFSQLYSNFSEQIARMDNHGFILYSPELLDDTTNVARDTDRKFVIATSINPMAVALIERGVLDATIVDDYYGYGFLSAKVLLEKICANFNPERDFVELPPALYTKNRLNELKKLWLSWLR